MSKVLCAASFFVIFSLLSGISSASAQMGPKNGDTWQPNLPGPAPAVAMPLVVTDVVVDKTADNPVIAREQAIEESKRAAFMKLAEQNLSPEQLKSFQPPKDSDISMLVQDFEIQNEQMSSTRYVGTFTVRFRDIVRNYINIRETAPPPLDENYADEDRMDGGYDTRRRPPLLYTGRPPADPRAQYAAEEPGGDNGGLIAQTVLVLPYFENIAGRTLLWEEGNPWLRMWQNAMPKQPAAGRQFFVPLGDISDIASGASNGVWSGNYAAVDALMRAYGAEQAVLAVANKSGPSLTVDIYTYSEGNLKRRDTLKPYAGDTTEQEAYKKAMFETIAYMQASHKSRSTASRRVESISRDVTRELRDDNGTVVIDSRTQGADSFNTQRPLLNQRAPYNPPPQAAVPVTVVSAATNIDATMQFSDPGAWMDMQRRVSGLQPPVQVNISSLSANSVSFTLSSNAPIDVVKRSLFARGVELRPPAMEGGAVGRPVYDVRLGPEPQQP